MNVKELKELLSQYPDDYPIMEGPTADAAVDCYVEEINDFGANSFLLVIPFV